MGAVLALWSCLGPTATAGGAPAAAMGQGQAGGILVSTTALPDNDVVICLLDTNRDRLLVYMADGKRSRLRLLAARDVSADWSLTDFNNDPPLPKDIRARLEKTGAPADAGAPAIKAEPTP